MNKKGVLGKFLMLVLVFGLVLSSSAFLFADEPAPSTAAAFNSFGDLTVDDILNNDSSYSEISSDLRDLAWVSKSIRSWFDDYGSKSAFTPEASDRLGDGSPDHIQIGTDSIMFFGTGNVGIFDYLYYDSPDLDDKMFEFTIDSSVDYHTLFGFGFLVNCSTEIVGSDTLVSGYAVMFGKDAIAIKLIDGANLIALENYAMAATGTNTNGQPTFNTTYANVTSGGAIFDGYKTIKSVDYPYGTSGGSTKSFKIESSAANKSFTVELNGTALFTFNPGTPEGKKAENYPTNGSSGSDFGIFAAYTNHSCNALSYAKITNISLYSETVSDKTSKVTLKLLDFTDQNIKDSSKRGVLATFEKTGYAGQRYIITPPQKIGKYVNINDEDKMFGIYGADDAVIDDVVKYASPTIVLVALNERGLVVSSKAFDGLELNKEYIISPNDLRSKIYTPKNTKETKTVMLTKTATLKSVSFYYITTGDGGGIAKTSDTTDALWALAAFVSCLVIAVSIGIKRADKKVVK
jgi:hypothetical protein